MKDRSCRCVVFAGALGVFSAGAMAQESRVAVTGKYGTIGPGVDLTYGWSRTLHTRVSLDYSPDEAREGKERIRAAGSLLLDWHPGAGAFRLSGGLALVHRQIAGLSSSTSTGTNSLTSYAGLGWGNPLRAGSRWSFSIDLGAFGGHGFSYSTAPEDPGASTSAARASRDSGNLRVRSTWEPVVATGLSYRF
jgi:hypothetical protein